LRLAYSALELSPWECRLTLWGTWSPGRADVARPGLFVDRSYVPVWPALLRRPLACLVELGTNVTRAGRFKEVAILTIADALRPDNRARMTPRRAGCLRDRPKAWFGHSGDDDPVPREACAHTVGPMGLGSRSPRVAPR